MRISVDELPVSESTKGAIRPVLDALKEDGDGDIWTKEMWTHIILSIAELCYKEGFVAGLERNKNHPSAP